MQSFIINVKEKGKAVSFTETFCREKNIDKLDLYTIGSEDTFGINDAKELQRQLFLRPFKSKYKAVLISIVENITHEAQNALLKALEEPPPDSFILISVANSRILLPTILSRCKIINLDETNQNLTEQDSQK